MSEIDVRPYRDADCDALIRVVRTAVRQVARRDYTHDQVLAWAPDDIDRERFGAHRASHGSWVAEIGGEPVGFTGLEPDGHVDMLYVHAEHQSKGVARALLDKVSATAHQQGITRLYTEASITARPVFERHGFSVIRAQTVAVRGQTLVNYQMEAYL